MDLADTPKKPSYEELEAAVASLRKGNLELRHGLLITQIQLMEASQALVLLRMPQALAEFSALEAELKKQGA